MLEVQKFLWSLWHKESLEMLVLLLVKTSAAATTTTAQINLRLGEGQPGKQQDSLPSEIPFHLGCYHNQRVSSQLNQGHQDSSLGEAPSSGGSNVWQVDIKTNHYKRGRS